MKKLHRVFARFPDRLGWKLTLSYLIVIGVGLTTLAIAAQLVVTGVFNRHIVEMEAAMSGVGQSLMQEMETTLLANFQSAFNEVLFIAAVAAVLSALFVSYFVAHRVVTPIRQMMQASKYIANGHYEERVDVGSSDELGQLARSFNQMASQLESTETMRRELIGNVTHELRTPLSSIKGYMEGLIDGVIPADPDVYQQVYREADRLQRLVDDLQELSRVESRAFELKRQNLNLRALIRQNCERLRPQFEEKGVHLEVNLSPALPPAWGDEDRLNQILVNLIGNALQYTPSGGSVSVSAKRRGKLIEVAVSDTGIGIPLEHLPHLFTRFYRVDKSRSRAGGGSGIGLTIVRHLVEAHGGSIRAQSEGAGKGSAFIFTLPL